jgi:hypothetical protein
MSPYSVWFFTADNKKGTFHAFSALAGLGQRPNQKRSLLSPLEAGGRLG